MAKLKFRMKIGEWATGGIFEAKVNTNNTITMYFKDWNTENIIREKTFSIGERMEAMEFLWDNTSSYYTDTILEGITDKLAFDL